MGTLHRLPVTPAPVTPLVPAPTYATVEAALRTVPTPDPWDWAGESMRMDDAAATWATVTVTR